MLRERAQEQQRLTQNGTMRSSAIQDFQQSFYLRASAHQGKMIWKFKNGLVHAVIVGEDFKGNLFVVCNKPEERKYELRPLTGFDDAYCYHQELGLKDNLPAAVAKAFSLLVSYNEYTDSTYLPTHRFEIPKVDAPTYEVSLSTEIGLAASDLFKVDVIKEQAENAVHAVRLALGLIPKRVSRTRRAVERSIQPDFPMGEIGGMTA